MSPLAKVFVVVNLILSVAFFGSSATLFATRVNWKQKAMDYRQESEKSLKDIEERYKSQGTRLVELAKQHSSLNTNFNSLLADKNKVETERVEVKGQLDKANSRIDNEVKEKTELQKTQQDLVAKNADITRLLETARKEAEDAKAAKEVAVNDMTRFKVDLDRLADENSKTLIAFNELSSKAQSMEFQLAAVAKSGVNVALLNAVPPIDAVIQAVGRGDEKLVVLSVGKDQRVQEGFQFTVYRGDRFVGKVQVIKVYEDLAGAKVLFTQEGEAIQVGDKAATQL